MLNTSFHPGQVSLTEEGNAVRDVLLSNKVNYWTGQECRAFETEFAAWCGVPHAVALANGTLALDVALKALGIGPGDEVVVTPRTFMASVSCVVNAGDTPVFADVDADSGNLSAATIAQVLTPAYQGRHRGALGRLALRHRPSAVVGMAAVVTKSVSPGATVVGHPARVLGGVSWGRSGLQSENGHARGPGHSHPFEKDKFE